MTETSKAKVLVCGVPRLALVVLPPESPVCPGDALLRRFNWLRERDPAEVLHDMIIYIYDPDPTNYISGTTGIDLDRRLACSSLACGLAVHLHTVSLAPIRCWAT